jgi:hypothetical protein
MKRQRVYDAYIETPYGRVKVLIFAKQTDLQNLVDITCWSGASEPKRDTQGFCETGTWNGALPTIAFCLRADPYILAHEIAHAAQDLHLTEAKDPETLAEFCGSMLVNCSTLLQRAKTAYTKTVRRSKKARASC